MSAERPAPPVLVLAAGLGTRLRPLTDRVPKCLVEIDGLPLLDRWHRAFAAAGISEVTINVHAHAGQVRDWLAAHDGADGVGWRGFEEPELLGSAGTLRALLPELERAPDFLVVYADNATDLPLGALVRAHREREAEMTVALFEAPDPTRVGVAELDAEQRIVSFEEKPERPRSNLANAGVYMVSRGVLGPLLGPDVFDLAFDVLPAMVGRMHGFVWDGYHRDIGDLAALRQAETDWRTGVWAPGGCG